jgi:hypothetical protein
VKTNDYLPHRELMARCYRLPVSAAARCLAMVLLSAAGPTGTGEGCESHEAMLVRRNKWLMEVTRSSAMAVKRAKRELRPYVRMVRVNARQRLPRFVGSGDDFTGPIASVPALAYYVDLAALGAQVGAAWAATPVRKTRPEAQPSLANVLEAYWFERIGHGRIVLAHQRAQVERAIAKVLGLATEQDVRDVIDGASTPALGGGQYVFLKEHSIWDHRLFWKQKELARTFVMMLEHVRSVKAKATKRPAPKPARAVEAMATQEQAEEFARGLRGALARPRRSGT